MGIIAKGSLSQRTPYANSLLTNNKNNNNQKTTYEKSTNVETKTDAKVRGFLADSKKLARYLSELLRQGW